MALLPPPADAPPPLPDLACPAAIRPGAASNSCTLNFVVTDGVDLYVGAAGHCASVGKRLRVAGVPGEVGTFVLAKRGFPAADWAFARVDPEDRRFVDPTMCRWAGPTSTPLAAEGVRAPLPGEALLHYGHGNALGASEPTRGRAGAALPDLFGGATFTMLASVSYGDSGSPVRLATGEAAGIAVAAWIPGTAPTLVAATRFDLALADLAAALGRPVRLVEGGALPALPLPTLP